MAEAGNRVRLDLNSPEFLDVFFRLDASELKQVVASLRRLQGLERLVSAHRLPMGGNRTHPGAEQR